MNLRKLAERNRVLPYVAAAWTAIIVLGLTVVVARVTSATSEAETLLVFRLGGGVLAALAAGLAWFVVSEPLRLRERVDEATRALQQSERRFRQLYDQAPLTYITLDEEGRIERVNERATDLLGYTEDELTDRPVIDLFEPGPDGREEAAKLLEQFTGGDPVRGEELAMLDAAGERVWVSFAVRPIEDIRGDGTDHTLSMVVDVTDRRRAEERLRFYALELERSNQDLEQFASVVSHDLQEPLRMIKSYLGLLERRYEDELDEDAHEFIDYAVDGAARMEALIQSLLRYSRVGTRAEPVEPVDLDEVMDEVLADLSVRIEETGAGVEFDDLPTVEADPNQVRQLFQNLVSNAIKHSEGPSSRVRIEAEPAGDRWRIAVEDDGPGIPEEHRETVFEIFQRVGARPGLDGTGIGLAICKRIVERHDGEIHVEDAESGGARFVFTLPAVNPTPADPREPPARRDARR